MNPFFSIVTPTYNRANLLSRVFSSLQKQSFNSFEWIVIDDGSIDNTESVIRDMGEIANFKIKYIKTHNQGKANALNESIKHCQGVLYLVFDSDDWCDDNALEVFYNEYIILKKRSDFDNYAALSVLKRYQSGDIVGDDYTKLNKYGLTYIDRINKGIQGDKWECLIFNKMHHLRYHVAKNDKYMAPSYVWLSLADNELRTVFINRALSTIEYQSDGISKNNLTHRLGSINTTVKFYRYAYKLKNLSYLRAGRNYSNYVRFSMHSNKLGDVSIYYLPFYLLGLLLYLKDK